MDSVKLLTLFENQASPNKGLAAGHGLSFYLQKGELKIMFDFGPGREAWENGRKMNVPFGEIRYGILSHSHYDHSCGFLQAEEYGFKGRVICGKAEEFFRPKYSLSEEPVYTYMGCGFSKEYLERCSGGMRICGDMLELGEGCFAAGNFARECLWEQIPGKYVREGASGMEPDKFTDEICLVLVLPGKDKGLALVTGCSHPGIVNMVQTVKRRWNMPVRTVIGGLHCAGQDDERLEKTAKSLWELGVREAAVNHCSGERIREAMAGQGIRSFVLKTGDCLCL